MSSLSYFLKKNKKMKENTTLAATDSLCDEAGRPLLWTIRPLTTAQSEDIRVQCTEEVPVPGKPGMYRQKIQSGRFLEKLICASVVEPNLNSAELQDSYNVSTPEALLKELVDDPGEYNALALFIQHFNHMDESLQDKVEEAKN